ncbi:MAG: CPBP family intramembrane metalloprotease [Bacilli bacterium]|nr:CPBP family intramembrane metalloprotease [Bacilli bacterium]
MKYLKELYNDIKPFIKYFRFVFILLLFLMSSIFKLIPITIFNIDVNNMTVEINCLLTLFSYFMLSICCILLYFKEIKEQFISLFKMKTKKKIIVFDTAFRYWLIGLIIMLISNFIIGQLGIGSPNNDTAVRNMLEASPIIAGLSVILIAPFNEEVVFRMAFRDIIPNNLLYVLTSGIIFGGLHVIGSINTGYELLFLIPYCSLGIAFSKMYQDSNNVFVSYSIHFIHNALTAFVTFLLAGVVLW